MKRAALVLVCLCNFFLSGCEVAYSLVEGLSPSDAYGPVDPYAGGRHQVISRVGP
jgi:hypothetical protein